MSHYIKKTITINNTIGIIGKDNHFIENFWSYFTTPERPQPQGNTVGIIGIDFALPKKFPPKS
jgi:hypothetical protein